MLLKEGSAGPFVIISGDIMHRICRLVSSKSRVYIIVYDDFWRDPICLAEKMTP